MAPPLPAIAPKVPSDRTPITLLRGTETVPPLDAAIVAVTTATTPLEMLPLFMPVARHVTVPLPLKQLRLLPAAVRAGPAAVESDVIAFDG